MLCGHCLPADATCLLALVCSGQPGLSRLLECLLSSCLLSALADMSYEVYLLHLLVSPPAASSTLLLQCIQTRCGSA